MSDFAVTVMPVGGLEPIPGADFIELAKIEDYRCVVKKGDFKPNQMVAYIPEGAVVPPNLLEEMGLTGKLHGADRNRVKAIRLKGCLSQGLVYPVANIPCVLGDDLAETLGITKYSPHLPRFMSAAPHDWATISGRTIKYDIENLKKWPRVLEDGERVEITEKIHGTLLQVGFNKKLIDDPDCFDGWFITSKGIGGKGFAYKNNEANEANLYVRTVKRLGLLEKLEGVDELVVLGEIYGTGIQDMGYGVPAGEPEFRVFDVWVGPAHEGRYMGPQHRRLWCGHMGLSHVPLLYEGPWSRAIADELVDGSSTLAPHIREGIVIKPWKKRRDDRLGRVILKHVSAAYLTRKGDTTEYQ